MSDHSLTEPQKQILMSCLDHKLHTVLQKIDSLKKRQGYISDSLYNDFMQTYENELQLINSTYLVLTQK